MRNKIGKIVALHIGPHYKRSETCVWVPKVLVSNVKGPKQVWVSKKRPDSFLWAYSSDGRSWVLDSG
jgi:hypothetical protein